MAKFVMELPEDILKDFQKLYSNSEDIFKGMTKAGAEVAYNNVMANMPASLQRSGFRNCVKLTRPYNTPSDDGVSTKVIISGYFINHNGRSTPAPLVANVFEHGKKGFVKKPFFRRSFNKSQIESAMLSAQKRLSGGLLDE